MSTTATVERLVVRRRIAASAEALFDAWLDPKALAVWMRPGGASRSTATVDARVGGRFEIVMHTPGGAVAHRGAYETIDRPRRLVFTWNSVHAGDGDSRVTVEFQPEGGATEVVITHERLPDAEAVGKHRGGWTEVLAHLDGFALGRTSELPR
ncbi:MAG TPA: SRPBCC family protein [Casimicrobiaceae bacterium]|nr:SRPBCC family protein [Casimicrobiaceae bacterium]